MTTFPEMSISYQNFVYIVMTSFKLENWRSLSDCFYVSTSKSDTVWGTIMVEPALNLHKERVCTIQVFTTSPRPVSNEGLRRPLLISEEDPSHKALNSVHIAILWYLCCCYSMCHVYAVTSVCFWPDIFFDKVTVAIKSAMIKLK